MDLNKIARELTLKEGLKKSLSIAQVKEVMRLTIKKLSSLPVSVLVNIFKKYQK